MISDVRRRELNLNTEYKHPTRVNINQIYKRIFESYNPKNIDMILENWYDLDINKNIAFGKVLDLLEYTYDKGNIGDINKVTSYIVEDVIPKIRDANQLEYSIKRKIGSTKTKITTKIHNKVDAANNAVAAAIAKISSSPAAGANSPAPKASAATPASVASANPKSTEADNAEKKDAAVKESMDKILKEFDNTIRYDRIISNHNKLCRRFNIDRVVRESVFTSNMVPDCVIELCKLIDTYNIPSKAKYAICIENCLFALDKNGVPYNRKDIVNNVTDYFLTNHNESGIIDSIKYTLENSSLYTKEDLKDISYIYDKDTEKEFDKTFNANIFNFDMKDSIEDISEAKNVLNNITSAAKAGKESVKDLFNKFKMLPEKSASALETLVKKAFLADDRNIVENYDNILSYIFSFIIITGAIAIHPVIGVVAAGTTYIIQMHYQRKETEKFLEKYKKQKEHAEAKLKTLKTQDSKDRCQAYIKQLDSDINKLQSYYDDMLTDKEKYGTDDDDILGGSDDLDEAAIDAAETIVYADKIIDHIIKSDKEYSGGSILDDIEKNITKMDCGDLDLVREFAMSYPGMIDNKALLETYASCLMETRKEKDIRKYIKIDCLNENLDYITNIAKSNPSEAITENNLLNKLYDIAVTRDCIKEYFSNINKNNVVLNEMNFTNTINLLIERVKNSAVKLSDKEKIMSKTLDSSLDMLKNNMENALAQENREAVIRGNILPPVSKIIKLAVTAGAVGWLLNPAISVIGLLGVFAMSKNLRTKERQIILDELDVELTMTDKYIHLAEERNQMKNLRELLMIKKKLEAQRNRLKYKMDIEWKTQSNPSSSGNNSSSSYDDEEY